MTHPIDRLQSVGADLKRLRRGGRQSWPEKRYLHGTHRSRTPDETLERILPLAARIGVTRVADVTGLDIVGLPVVMVVRPNSRSLAVHQGKGLTLTAAKVSGLMESLERWHGEECRGRWRIAERRSLARRHRVIPLARLPWTARRRLRSDQPTAWVRGFDLLASQATWIPYQQVHHDLTPCAAPNLEALPNASTGLAVGNDYPEALVHALCEVIERDQTTLWRLLPEERQDRHRLDLASLVAPAVRAVVERVADAGLGLAVWSAELDLGVPVYVSRVYDTAEQGTSPLLLFDGAGCHPSREVALLRSLTEALQGRLTYISGARDDLLAEHYRRPTRREFRDAERRLKRPGVLRFKRADERQHGSSLEDLAWLLERLRKRGVASVVAVDLRRPELALPAVRVVVPDLEDGEEMPDYQPRRRALLAYLDCL